MLNFFPQGCQNPCGKLMKGSFTGPSQKMSSALEIGCSWEKRPLPADAAAGTESTKSALYLVYSLFTPHSSLVIEASRTVASLPSPKALGMLPVDAIFIPRKRHSKKTRCASGLLYLHCVIPRAFLNARSSPQLVWFQIPACQVTCCMKRDFVSGVRVCCCSRMLFWSRCSSAVLCATVGTLG